MGGRDSQLKQSLPGWLAAFSLCVGVAYASTCASICHVNKSFWRKKQLKNKTQLQIVQGYTHTQLEDKYPRRVRI